MAVVDEFYDSTRRDVGEPVVVSYWKAFMKARLAQNEPAEPDLRGLEDEADDLRRRLVDLAKLKQAAASGDSQSVSDIAKEIVRYRAQTESARIRGQATVSAAEVRAKETALRNSIRANDRLQKDLGLSGEDEGMIRAFGDDLVRASPTAPQAVEDQMTEEMNARLSAAKDKVGEAGSPGYDARAFRIYQEAVAAGQSTAAMKWWAEHVDGSMQPEAYMAERHDFETPQETKVLLDQLRGGVGRAMPASAVAEEALAYGTGTSTSRRTSVSGTSPDQLLSYVAEHPTDTSAIDALFNDTMKALQDNQKALESARSGRSRYAGMYPNAALHNPFQVVRGFDPRVAEMLRPLDAAGRSEATSNLMQTRGPFGQFRPDQAAALSASQGGFDPGAPAWANLPDAGPNIGAWAAQRVDRAASEAAGNPDEVRILRDGAWTYAQAKDGTITIMAAPEGSRAKGAVLRNGKAFDAITAKFGGYHPPAYDRAALDVAAMPEDFGLRGVAAYLATGDATKAGTEAARASTATPTFGEAYRDAFAGASDEKEAQAVLDSLAALPEDAGGPWRDAYLRSAHRGTLVDDVRHIGGAITNVTAPRMDLSEPSMAPEDVAFVRNYRDPALAALPSMKPPRPPAPAPTIEAPTPTLLPPATATVNRAALDTTLSAPLSTPAPVARYTPKVLDKAWDEQSRRVNTYLSAKVTSGSLTAEDADAKHDEMMAAWEAEMGR